MTTDTFYEETKGLTAEERREIFEKNEARILEEEKAEKIEIVKIVTDPINELTDETQKEIALELLLPFVIQNIGSAKASLLKRLTNKIETGGDVEKVKAPRAVSKVTYQLIEIDKIKNKTPNVYKHLVENVESKPLVADNKYLVVKRATGKISAKASTACKADKFESLVTALDSFGNLKAQIEKDADPLALPVSAFVDSSNS